jgi:hypothetical protein
VVTCLSLGLLACGSDDGSITDGASSDAGWVVHRIQDGGDHLDAGCNGADCSAADATKLDLLFIVDNSSSMKEEQAALRREFPSMIRKLVSGDHDGNGKLDHAPVTDLHIGVVSSNMGADPRVRGCEGLGDDGLLQHSGNIAHDGSLDCKADYPSFLSYARGKPPVDSVARDFACIASLGSAGCGFEQHLESGLKALWPAASPDLTFLGLDAVPTTGHGDRENAGFLRTGDANRAATLAVVVIADEDDCSSVDRGIFNPASDADSGSPYYEQPLNLRCYYNHAKAFPLERYTFGFQHLGSRRVVFAAIVGVPVDLVDAAARSQLDVTNTAKRDAYYDKLLADRRMQETLDGQSGLSGTPTDLVPACTSALGRAYPARRFVELAKRFGADALIQSICGDGFGSPIDQIVERVTVHLD